MTLKSAIKAENYLEVVADIAFMADNMVGHGQLELSDSRQLMSNIATWAKDFEVAFEILHVVEQQNDCINNVDTA